MPPLERGTLYANQIEASPSSSTPSSATAPARSIQMATGSGKTIAAITAIYRLIKFGGARRVLFLVDRSNLGEQAEKEFQGYRAPDVNRKFTELYNVQRLSSNTIMDSSRVVISTIQRVYSMLKGEPDSTRPGGGLAVRDERRRDQGAAPGRLQRRLPARVLRRGGDRRGAPLDLHPVAAGRRVLRRLPRRPHRDALKQTLGFFNKNLVMEYDHERAVADGVNVDFEVYNIRTKITERGATVEAKPDTMLGYRDRQTRALRWETPDEDLTYDPNELDRRVVARDQIRTIIRTFRDRLPIDIFPGRKEVPKTLIFAKDDSHAEDIVEIVRDEFGRGNAFCQKITYKVTGANPRDLIQAFRNQYEPRIAVTVDMVATGTDIKPIEIVMFMRAVKSRVLFEQMKGRGVRVIDPNDLRAVSGEDAVAKTHFVIVDCVGMTETQLADTQPLDRKRTVSLKALLEHVAMGGTDPELLSSLASRLARLSKQCGPEEHARVVEASGGPRSGPLPRDRGRARPRPADRRGTPRLRRARRAGADRAAGPAGRRALLKRATEPLATKARAAHPDPGPQARGRAGDRRGLPGRAAGGRSERGGEGEGQGARRRLRALHRGEQGRDRRAPVLLRAAVLEAPLVPGHQGAGRGDQGAAARVDAREALARLRDAAPDKVRGASGKRLLTDIVSLVRFATHQDDELVPFGEHVRERFEQWMAQQGTVAERSPEQRGWR
jgi:type I restriction enzyme, R subunit